MTDDRDRHADTDTLPPAALLRPDDTHNRRLEQAVHPRDWTNPVPKDRYHLVVIGAGTAGLVAAAGAAGLGARVALVERHLMGGDCLNVGCVPSKALLGAARAWTAARRAAAEFHGPTASGTGDFGAVMERLRRLRADIAPVDGATRFKSLGVDVYLGDARFTDRDTVAVGDATLRFRRAIIATGARAVAPPIPGLRDGPYLTNESLFELTECPPHLVIIGAGPIGCEMAQAFARFGARVTLVDQGTRVLPRDDADAARIVQRALEADGVQLRLGTGIQRVEYRDGTVTLHVPDTIGGASRIEGSHLLVAAGRAPNVENLALERAGVAYTAAGVTVDDRLRTSTPGIFACGDVASRLQFTHAADFQARTAIQNALFFGRKKWSRIVVPWATYTSPEVAHVGHTAESARAAGVDVDTFEVPLHDNDRALLDGQTDGFVRIHVRAGSDTIVGATIVAEHAGDLLAEVTLCLTNGLGLGAIGGTIHPYPTQGDAVRRCADQWRKTRLTPTVRRAFSTWFRLFT